MASNYYYPTSKNGIQKTLAAQLLNTASTGDAITFSDVDGVENKPGVLVINRINANGADTPSAREFISYSGTSGNTVLIETRNVDGSGATRTHVVNSIVEFVADGVWGQRVIDQALVAHEVTGVHKSGLVLPSPVITTPQINDTSADHQYILGVSELTADRTITLPLLTGNDDFVFEDHTQTLTNKTLSTGVALNASASENFTYHSLARQAIINGNFDVWQRGTTATNQASGDFLADRWKSYKAAGSGGALPTNVVESRQLLTPGDIPGSFYYFRVAPDGAGTTAAAQLWQRYQPIEHGTRLLCGDGKTVTLSFYARASVASKKLGVYFEQNYGTTGSPSSVEQITGDAFTLTSSWVKYTLTVTTNTLASKTFGTDNNDYLNVVFAYAWGTDYDQRVGESTAETFVGSGTIDIAQVQLCAGSVALPFQPRSYQDELIACQRYYQLVGKGSVGRYVGSSSVNVGYQFLVTPRITTPTPTLTTTSPVIFRTAIGNDTGSSSSITSSGGGWVQINGLSGGSTNEICVMTDNYIVWNAEL